MNITAHQVVACERTVAAPRGPNAVWLPAPPNAPARSAAFPLCSSTTMISTRQFRTKNAFSNHPANRNPNTMIANPSKIATAHFIQPGIASAPQNSLEIPVLAGYLLPDYLQLTIAANDFASRLAPPTSAPSNSCCAINPSILSGFTLPP